MNSPKLFSQEWTFLNEIWFRGYFFTSDSKLYEGDAAVEYIKMVSTDFKKLKELLKSLSGSFAGIIHNENENILFTDRLRSIPLFYSSDGENTSDNAYELIQYIEEKEIVKISEKEFLNSGFVSSFRTIIKNILQVEASQVVQLGNGFIKTSYYYVHLPNRFSNKRFNDYYNELDKIFDIISLRVRKFVKNRTVIIPLSGGYDSRTIAVIAKKAGIKDVLCYTYGQSTDLETVISKKVARKLGFKWILVKESKDELHETFSGSDFIAYSKLSFNLVSRPSAQDYNAVKFIFNNKLAPTDSVIIPGHSMDLLGGSHITNLYMNYSNELNLELLLKSIEKKYYNNIDCEENKSAIRSFLSRSISSVKNVSLYSVFDSYNVFNRQAKYIVNSVRVYEFWGYNWMIPLWDNLLMDFWYSVDVKYRVNNKLLNSYLLNQLFYKYDITFVKKELNLFNKLVNVGVRVLKTGSFKGRILRRDIVTKILAEKFEIPLSGNPFYDWWTVPMKAMIRDLNKNEINN